MAAWRCLEVAQGSNDQLGCFYTLYNPPPLQQSCIGYGGDTSRSRQDTVLVVNSVVCFEELLWRCTLHVHPIIISGLIRPNTDTLFGHVEYPDLAWLKWTTAKKWKLSQTLRVKMTSFPSVQRASLKLMLTCTLRESSMAATC